MSWLIDDPGGRGPPSLVAIGSRVVEGSRSALGFATTGGENWPVWDRFLTVAGVPAFHLGNVCGTCEWLFARLEPGGRAVDVGPLTARLAAGLSEWDDAVVDDVAALMPDGRYRVALTRLSPVLVEPGTPDDWFSTEREPDGTIIPREGCRHDPLVAYYRSLGFRDVAIGSEGDRFAEFVVPMASPGALDAERVDAYSASLAAGRAPTALSLSVLDRKQRYDCDWAQWCLAHFLLDGHHKVAAAARAGRPLTLLAFVALDQGVSTDADAEAAFDLHR